MANPNSVTTLADYFDVVRRRWVYLALILPAVLLVAVYQAYTITPSYRSSATIMLEPSTIPADMIRTTVVGYADQHIDMLRRRVMTTEELRRIVEARDPYPDMPELSLGEKARLLASDTQIERVDPVTLERLNQSNAFSIHYHNPNPRIAADVAQRLADMFLDHNRQIRAEKAAGTYDFLLTQSTTSVRRIREVEQRIADFKSLHGDALPDAQARTLGALDRTERELTALEGQIRLAEERETLLALQLTQITPNLFDTSQDWRLELAALRAQLAEAQQRYTPDHPDVRRLRRSIDALNARVASEESSGQSLAPDNPDYIRVASQLDTVRRDLAAMRASAAQARQQIQQYGQVRRLAPDVERQYLELMREYDGLQGQFADIQNKLSAAALAETLETEQRGERYTQIRSPSVASSPVHPNRMGIILLGLVIGGALAVGVAAFKEVSDPTIRSAKDLRDITDIQPIGAVPVMLNHADKRKRLLTWTSITAVFAVAVLFVGTTVLQEIERAQQMDVQQITEEEQG
jgi:polysaccharide biosynthesis transport protein